VKSPGAGRVSLNHDGLSQKSPAQAWEGVISASIAAAGGAPLDCLLAGMVAAGLGIEALCLYLDVARTVLFDRLVALGLPMPHDRPLRRAGGRSPWTVADVQQMIGWWTDGVHVRSMSDANRRSRGSIYAKLRRLGLCGRDRKSLIYRTVSELLADGRDDDVGAQDHGTGASAAAASSFKAPRSPTAARQPSEGAPDDASAFLSGLESVLASTASLPAAEKSLEDLEAPAIVALRQDMRRANKRAYAGRKNGKDGSGQSTPPAQLGLDLCSGGLAITADCVSSVENSAPAAGFEFVVVPHPAGETYWPPVDGDLATQFPAGSEFNDLSLWKQPVAPKKKRTFKRLATRRVMECEKLELENRGLAGQRPKAIACEMGLTFCQVTSHLERSLVSKLRKSNEIVLVDTYDPGLAEENKRKMGLVRTPNAVKEKTFWHFWTKRRSGEKHTERFKKTKAYINATNSFEL
jgi:hypothetical protein